MAVASDHVSGFRSRRSDVNGEAAVTSVTLCPAWTEANVAGSAFKMTMPVWLTTEPSEALIDFGRTSNRPSVPDATVQTTLPVMVKVTLLVLATWAFASHVWRP